MKNTAHFLRNYHILFFILFSSSLFAQTDSLEQKLPTATKEEKIELYKKLANKHGFNNIERAIKYAKEGLALVETENSKNTGFFYLRLGNFYSAQSDHENALLHYTKALEVAKILGYEIGIGKCYQNIGVVYRKMGQYEKALHYYLETLKVYENNKEENLIVAVANNLGTLYSCRLHDDEKATIYYNKALELSEKSNNQEFRGYVLNNVSEMYMRQKQYNKAKETLKIALQVAEETKSVDITLAVLNNLAQISIDEQKYEQALAYSKRVLQKRMETGYSAESILSYLSLADIYEKLGDDKSAKSHYNKALSTAQEVASLPQLLKVYQALHEYFNRKHEWKKGYEYVLKYNTIKDSLFTSEKDKQLKEIQAKFDLESKEKEVELLTNENRIKELENTQQRFTQTMLLIGITALTLVLLAVIYAYKNKQKTARLLESKNLQISQTLKDREILLKEVHHRVKNNLQIVSSLLRLQHKFSGHKNPSDILQEIQDKIQAMAIIHERLYKSSDLSLINLKSYLDNLLVYYETSYNLPEQNIAINTSVENIELSMDYLVPCGLILNEIIANSIKYAFPESASGNISIAASRNENQCILTIQDSGIGFPDQFKIESCTSLGMQLIQGLTRQIKGSLEVISNPGAHYTITFNID